MAQRTCDTEGCEKPHLARGLCRLHYKREHGKRTRYSIDCVTCGQTSMNARPDGRFCSDACKGAHYRATMKRHCKLSADHPVMIFIVEARKRKSKPNPVRLDLRAARECPACASWFSPLHHSAATQMIACTDRCAKRLARRRRRAREHNTLNLWRWSDFMRVARRFDYCCAYCGQRAGQLDPDHVVPLSRGGADAIANLLPSCRRCNGDKRDLLLDEWAVDRAMRGKPSVTTAWTSGDSRYAHLMLTQARPLAA